MSRLKGEDILTRVREYTGNTSFARYDEINEAYVELMRRVGLYNSKREDTSLSLKSGESVYQLPVERIRSLIGIWIKDDVDWVELKETDEAGFQYVESLDTTSAVPTVFKLIGSGLFEVSQEPSASYPVKIVFLGVPEPLSPHTYTELPAGYDILVAQLAAANIMIEGTTAEFLRQKVGAALQDLTSDTLQNRGVGVDIPRQKILRA
jgi:hypothetical protein